MTTVSDGLFQYGGMPVGPAPFPFIPKTAQYFFVDGTNGADGNPGDSPQRPFATIQRALDLAGSGDVVVVYPKLIDSAGTTPVAYTETLTIANTQSNLSIIGVSHGRTYCGQPLIKMTTTTTALMTVRAPGVFIYGLGFDGANASTYNSGGGILLDDDQTTKIADSVTIANCTFRNCRAGTSLTYAADGGAIMWATSGYGHRARIIGNKFYDCSCSVSIRGATEGSRTVGVMVENNVFGGSTTTQRNIDIWVGTGSAIDLTVANNVFNGAVPTLGTTPKYIHCVTAVGIITDNTFSCATQTYGVTGTAVLCPNTVYFVKGWERGGNVLQTTA